MAEELLSLKWNNHQSHFMDILSFLREQEIFVDTTLACGGKLYAAHKFVLSTCSEYFKQMFIKNPTKHPIVFMKDVTSRDLEALLDFMYNGEVNVPQSSLGSLIKTAEGLQIKGLAVPDDPPVAKRDKDSIRDRHDKDHKSNIDRVHSPPPKRPRPRDRSSPQSSHVPGSLSRVRSPIPSSGPAESNVDEDSRTSVHSGISGHSEQTNVKSINIKSNVNNNSSNQFNSDNNPSLSSSENTVLNPLVDEPSPGPSGIQKHQSKVEEMEIKQEDVVDLGEDDDGDWGSGGGDGDALGDSSMGSDHNTSSFPDLMLPHNDGLSTSTDPAMDRAYMAGSEHLDQWWSSCLNAAEPLQSLLAAVKTNGHDINEVKRHICKFCTKRFHRKDHLQQHERIHTGEKPYICPVCGRGFNQRSPMICHMRKYCLNLLQ